MVRIHSPRPIPSITYKSQNKAIKCRIWVWCVTGWADLRTGGSGTRRPYFDAPNDFIKLVYSRATLAFENARTKVKAPPAWNTAPLPARDRREQSDNRTARRGRSGRSHGLAAASAPYTPRWEESGTKWIL